MIECQNVSFSYPASGIPGNDTQTGGALQNISCTIEDGSFVLLCGPSGCGKTTMTRFLNGLIPHYHEGNLPVLSGWTERIPANYHCLIFH